MVYFNYKIFYRNTVNRAPPEKGRTVRIRNQPTDIVADADCIANNIIILKGGMLCDGFQPDLHNGY